MSKTLGEVATYINGRAFKPNEWEAEGLPIIRIQNLNDPTAEYNYSTVAFEDKYRVQNGDLLFAWSASLGAHIWREGDAWLNQHIFRVIPNEDTDKTYLYYYLQRVIDELYAKTHGSGMVHITIKPFKATEIYLPAIEEQKRIVNDIERLFEKLDRAKELVQSALDSFENRRTAILHKAFTGELTAKWRLERGLDQDTWSTYSLSDVVLFMQNGLSKRRGKDGISTAVLRLANIEGNRIIEDDLREINLTSAEVEKYALEGKDVLLIRVNGSKDIVGKMVLIEGGKNWAFCDHLIKCRFDNSKVNSAFMVYMSQSDNYRLFIKANIVSSAGQNTVNQKILGKYSFQCPTILEQQEIVRILNAFLEKENRARELCDILDKIDLMKKAILAKAFRGELGTNDPTEEPLRIDGEPSCN
jgi:type I restriction enzyme S subunit